MTVGRPSMEYTSTLSGRICQIFAEVDLGLTLLYSDSELRESLLVTHPLHIEVYSSMVFMTSSKSLESFPNTVFI